MPYCPNALLPYCPNALLPYCPNALFPQCPNAEYTLDTVLSVRYGAPFFVL